VSANEPSIPAAILPRPFLGWLVVVYLGLGIVIVGGGHLEDAIANWPIGVAMAIGS